VFRPGLDAMDVHLMISSFCFYRVSNKHTFGQLFQVDFNEATLKLHHREMLCESLLRFIQAP